MNGPRTNQPSTNLELVRSIFAAWESGDFSSLAWADPKIELVIFDGPSPGSWRGKAEMAKAWRDLLGAYETLRSEPEEYRELDDERILVLAHFNARGRTSGLDLGHLRSRGAGLFHVRDGKVTRHVVYWDRERALADLGLAPERAAPG